MSYSAMTGQSLYYLGANDLKHKVLAISEEAGVTQAAYVTPLGAISTVFATPNDTRFAARDLELDRRGGLFYDVQFGSVLRRDYNPLLPESHVLGTSSVRACGPLTTIPEASSIGYYSNLELGPDGYLYVAESCVNFAMGNVRVRRVRVNGHGEFGTTLYSSADGSEVFEFDGDGRHLRTVHPLTGGTLRTFEYDEAGLLEAIEDGDGNRTTITRDIDGRATAIVAPFGQQTDLDYDAEGFLSLIDTDPNGNPHEFDYDELGLMEEQEDPRGAIHDYEFDEDGRITLSEDTEGGFYDYELYQTPTIHRVTETTAEGRVTVYEQSFATDGSGTTTFNVRLPTYTGSPATRHLNTLVVTATGTETTSMADGSVIVTTPVLDPVFGATVVTRDEHFNNGGFNRYRRSSRSVVLDVPTDPLSVESVTEVSCDDNNANTSNCPSGGLTTRVYNASTRTWQTTSGAGRVSTQVLDEQGRIISTQTSGSLATTFDYDEQGRLEDIEQGVRLESYTYDPTTGFLDTHTNAEAHVTDYGMDEVGRVTTVETDGDVTGFDYNDESLMTEVTPPDRSPHELSCTSTDLFDEYTAPAVGMSATVLDHDYNLDRQLELITQPDSSEIIYEYHRTNGQLVEATVPGAGTYSYAYNEFDNLSSVSNTAGGFGANAFSYGTSGSLTSTGTGSLVRLVTTQGSHSIPSVWTGPSSGIRSLGGTIYYWYDERYNQYLVEPHGAASQVNGFTAVYIRDGEGLVTGAVPAYANTGARNYWIQRSALDGHISGTCIGGSSYSNCMASTPRVSTTYDVDVDAMTPGTGDLLGFGASIGATEVYSVVYERDDLGRIERLDETIQSTTITRKYEYDPRGRLFRVRDDNDDIISEYEYEYDGNGARTRALTPAGEVELGTDLGCGVLLDTPVDAQDRLCRYGDYEYVYDDNGRLSTRTQISTSDETAYTYDGLGRLRRVVLPDATEIHYVHDALGRRIGKVVDDGVVAPYLEKGWLYGTDSLRPIAQKDADGQIEMTFVYATHVNVPDYIVDLEAPSKTYRVITDHLGSVRLVVNVATGAVVQRMDYDEFGNVLNDTNPGWQPFGFAGGLYDPDTGLVTFGARDYDALVGRWTAKDPILFGGKSANLYQYVHGDPVNFIEPSGLEDIPWCGPGGPGIYSDNCVYEDCIHGDGSVTSPSGYGAYRVASICADAKTLASDWIAAGEYVLESMWGEADVDPWISDQVTKPIEEWSNSRQAANDAHQCAAPPTVQKPMGGAAPPPRRSR